jgi:UDP-N-acetylglucosamine--N-acetylmuramyl-(pentapeptide) pyrophosphoryl-undecaprenol N-acetylglucosamine transferase
MHTKVIITAGGTGGHVIPAVVTANALKQKGAHVFFLTDQRGKSYLQNLHQDIPVNILPMGRRRILPLFLWDLLVCFLYSAIYVIRVWPKSVIGFGGFSSFPGLLAAMILARTLIIHEQNTVLGRTNRFFSPMLKKLFSAFPLQNQQSQYQIIGMPQDIVPTKATNDRFQLLILGGSQGAHIFTKIMPDVIKGLELKNLHVVHQAPQADVAFLKDRYTQLGVSHRVASFFTEMSEIYGGTSLMIARAGAATVSESITMAVPTIFVPLPSAQDNHQYYNAKTLTNAGAGWICQENTAHASTLAAMIRDGYDTPQKLDFVRNLLKKLAKKNVADRLASEILSV